tara:strand:- start:1420 stop:3045 length:1626 start_codon:yes stop_codon:yes gene_type:complete
MITSMASQLDSLGFINEGSTKRKEILAKFLDLQMFEEKHKLAKKDSAELKGIIKHLGAIDWNKKLVHGQEALEEILEEIEQQSGLCEKLKARIKELEEESDLIEDQLRSVEDGWIDIEQIESELEEKEREKQNLSGKIKLMNISRSEFMNKLNDVAERIDNEELTRLNGLIDKYKELSYDHEQLELDLKPKETKLRNLNKKIAMLHDHEYDPDCRFCCDNKFVKDANKAKEQAPGVIQEIQTIKDEITFLESEMEALGYEEILGQRDQLASFEDQKADFEAKIQKITTQVQMWNATKQLAKSEIRELRKKKDHYYENQEAFDNIDSLKRDVRSVRAMIENKTRDLARCEKKTMGLVSEEGATRQQIKEAEAKLAEIQTYERDYIAYDLFIQAMHPNGVSYRVIRSMLSVINSEIAKILNSIVDFEVFFDNVGSKLEIYIKHPKYDPRPLSMGSGAEKTIASMAIRLGLISITNLPKSELFILDEPATALDAEHMDGFIRLLQMIKSQFKTVLLISHLETLKDVVDMTIDIQKKDGYAHVQI